MKIRKYALLSLLILGLGAFLTSCKLTLDPALDATDVQIQIELEESLKNAGLSPVNTQVLLQDRNAGQQWMATTDASGRVTFPGVVGGVYSVIARRLVQMQEYSSYTGIPVDQDVVLIDSLINVNFTASNTIPTRLTLKVNPMGNWVIKQVYYAGSDTLNGAGIRDQFIEIYNNSNAELYADSLCVGLLQGVRSRSISSEFLVAETGQYDWSKSLNIPAAWRDKANTDYVYAHTLVMIPGNGSQYPVKPGESIIIAQNAQNHKTGYVGRDGKMIPTKTAGLTVDLSQANFEFYRGIRPSDVDNPAVPNVAIINANASDLEMAPQGLDAVVIFKAPQNLLEWPRIPLPTVQTITVNTLYNFQIPTTYLIDVVELQPSSTQTYPRKVPVRLDASYKYVPGGAYSSQSIIRKTVKTINTRRILATTANSQTDFGYFERAQPRGFQ
ncbi:DUF4876 domain-containing protein [Siphonobacter sp. SORGH_AS_1065]|uniref:DUF4876 domain-containing protein n=1 Tax=Siphonobacter sp. SORGH_AS_1065 TaxID=3041795 RepID=UPI00277E6D78|nr:DUF4876 domain-containing protein [Siphonobacter sp. SORGH_AS_1065]MDQ1087952.1 hypothetical protein [Siphonobacter sp. SORGH_AS_1065]